MQKRPTSPMKETQMYANRPTHQSKETQMCAIGTYMYPSDKRDSNVFKRDVQRRQKRPFHQTEVSQMYAKETHCVEKRDPLTR